MLLRILIFFVFALFSFIPALAAPIEIAALSKRLEENTLVARDLIAFNTLEERDINFEKRDDYLYELNSRSPEPAVEDIERRGKLGAIFKIGKKIIGKIAGAFHRKSNGQNNQNPHGKRSKIGNKIKNFFKKVGNGVRQFC
jgi:hypothetical protein